MPYRTKETLEMWLGEFYTLGHAMAETLKVMPQDGSDGEDTGLVGITLMSAQTITYIQPEPPGSTNWMVTFEARDTPVQLDADGAMRLSKELAVVSELCRFLQARSEEYMAAGGED